MARAWDAFVVLGDMRTGSNLLEERLNACPGLRCHGEAFNPVFAGHAGETSILGLTLAERDRDPLALVARIGSGEAGVLGGFRLFPEHDPRVLHHCLATPRIAKVVLARNPVESYVSLKIARQTGQWWLGDVRSARRALVRFDADEFEAFLARQAGFYGTIRRALQTSGQTAFHVHYDDLGDAAVIEGLARWLGATGPAREGRTGRVQNPEPLEEKVENFAEMAAALGRADAFDLYRVPDFEPRRGPNVPGWMASDALKLLHLPMAGGPVARVAAWMAAAGDAVPGTGRGRKEMRDWMGRTPGFRSFTVVTEPLRRMHDAFSARVLATGPEAFLDIREVLRARHGIDLPEGGPGPDWTVARHRAAFLAFLGFVKANLAGQTSVRVPAAWASQAGILRGFAEVAPPDLVLRAETLDAELARLAPGAPPPPPDAEPGPVPLSQVRDAEVEAAARAAAGLDYVLFGYGSA